MCAYGSINGQSDFGGQPQPSAEQGVLCCKRSFMQQKTYLAMSGRALTGLKDWSDELLPAPLYAVGLVLSTDLGGWTSLCSVKRKRPFPPCVRGRNLPDWKQDRCVRCRSPAYHV